MSHFTSIRPFNGQSPSLAKGAYIDPCAVVIGDVHLGEDSSIWPCAVIRGDMHKIRIGARTSVQDNAVLHITHASDFNLDGWPLIIGDDVTIGHGACLHGCVIGSSVLVGIGATVLDGAIVEDKVIIAAGTLVPPKKVLESGFMYKGSPAVKARALSESELKFFKYSAMNYVNLKNRYIEEQA